MLAEYCHCFIPLAGDQALPGKGGGGRPSDRPDGPHLLRSCLHRSQPFSCCVGVCGCVWGSQLLQEMQQTAWPRARGHIRQAAAPIARRVLGELQQQEVQQEVPQAAADNEREWVGVWVCGCVSVCLCGGGFPRQQCL